MRVLHLLKTSHGGSWARRQIKELVALGLNVHVALPNDGPFVGRYSQIGAIEHLLQTDFPINRPWRFPELSMKFRSLTSDIQPEIIHSHFVGTTLTMRLALGRNHLTPRIFQVPGPLHLEHPFFRVSEIKTACKSDYWVGSCRWTCNRYIASGIGRDRIFLSYYGGDLESITLKSKGKLRKELNTDANTIIIGMVAFMYAPKRYIGQKRGLKGHEDLIDAVAICRKKYPNIHCVLIGGAWNNAMEYEKSVREYASNTLGDAISILGNRDDVPALYPDFDIAVHASHSENVGGAVESLLNGIPTITTKVGGFPDLIHSGKTGILVPPSNPRKLADAIIHLLDNREKAAEMATKGKDLAKKMFDIRDTSRGILKIYQTILNRNPHTSNLI